MVTTDLVVEIYTSFRAPTTLEQHQLTDFLYKHLGKYGDAKADINKALDYAFKRSPSFGGYVVALKEEDTLLGVVVVNKTGMSGYIPENILVYIAIHEDYQGKGLGKRLMQEAMKQADGDIALHVEPDNPARFLYEKLGFTSKYMEMRWTGDKDAKKKGKQKILSNKELGENMYPFLI